MKQSGRVILRIDSSARQTGSTTRQLSDELISNLIRPQYGGTVIERDVSKGLPLLDEDWVKANFTPDEDRTEKQKKKLSFSDSLVEELERADTIVIGLPIYNFGIPAALKAWIDMVARARLTFRYTPDGPEGLLIGKRAILVVASGGTQIGSDSDFATSYMRHALKFIGITDVTIVSADQMGSRGKDALEAARLQLSAIAA